MRGERNRTQKGKREMADHTVTVTSPVTSRVTSPVTSPVTPARARNKGSWFRLYECVLDDPKVQRLPAPLFKTWVNLLCAASKCGGALPSLGDLAFMLRVGEDELAESLKDLKAVGLIDGDGDELRPHNWDGLQWKSDTSRERQKRYRDRHRNVTRDVTGDVTTTVTVTARESQSQSQIRKMPPALPRRLCSRLLRLTQRRRSGPISSAARRSSARRPAASWST